MFNKKDILEAFGEYCIKDGNHPNWDGVQMIFKFENGYGASLINAYGSYGNEIAVLRFENGEEYEISYSTHITNDVLAYLQDEEVIEKLQLIKELED